MPSNYQTELKSWLRKLDILRQENVMLKNKVVDILQNDVDQLTLEQVENYLLCFIERDAFLALLRMDVAGELQRAGYYQNEEANDVKHLRLRRDLAKMEYEFYKLKMDFHSYVSQFNHAA